MLQVKTYQLLQLLYLHLKCPFLVFKFLVLKDVLWFKEISLSSFCATKVLTLAHIHTGCENSISISLDTSFSVHRPWQLIFLPWGNLRLRLLILPVSVHNTISSPFLPGISAFFLHLKFSWEGAAKPGCFRDPSLPWRLSDDCFGGCTPQYHA